MASAKVEKATVMAEHPPVTKEEETKSEEKAVKEKKVKATKEKKPKQTKAAAHPPYFEMIKEALLALNEKSGSSPYAIAKYVEEKHKPVLPPNFKKTLSLQLKNSASKGKLVKVKASYKLSDAGKKDKPATPKLTQSTRANAEKTKPKSKRISRKTRSVNKVDSEAAARKVVKQSGKRTRKSAGAKPKQPKSIKNPGAKRAKKAVAA